MARVTPISWASSAGDGPSSPTAQQHDQDAEATVRQAMPREVGTERLLQLRADEQERQAGGQRLRIELG